LFAHRIFDEIRRHVPNQLAAPYGLGKIEALVEIDAPVAILTQSFASLRAIERELVEPLVRIERAVGPRVAGAHANRAVTGLDRQPRPVFNPHSLLNAGDRA